MRDFGGFPPVQYMSCVLEQRSDASATHEVSEPMPHEDHADLTQARQLTGRAEQPGDHWLLLLPQADQCLLEIVIGEVLPPGRKLLEGAMRCAGGFHERIVKLPHCFGEEFSGLRTDHRGTAGRPTKDGAGNLSDGLGIDPALLQNLARQLFDAFSDRLVFDRGRRGGCWRCGRLPHVLLLGCCWSQRSGFCARPTGGWLALFPAYGCGL